MCLLKPKRELEYSVPARVHHESKWSRTYSSPSPPRTARYSRTRVVEERREAPPAPLPAPPPQSHYSHHSEYRRSEAPSPPRSHYVEVEHTLPPPRSHYVEVEHDSDSSSSSDDVRSRTTHKTSKTSHTRKSSRPPPSEYSIHEREQEIRRERVKRGSRGEYETYQYVNAPPGRERERRAEYDPRASSGSHRRISVGYYR